MLMKEREENLERWERISFFGIGWGVCFVGSCMLIRFVDSTVGGCMMK